MEQARLTIQQVPARAIPVVWETVRPFIEKALEHGYGEFDSEGISRRLLTEQLTLWVVVDNKKIIGVFVLEVVGYDNYRVLRTLYLAGKGFAKWRNLYDAVTTDYARQHACHAAEFYGRKGWLKHAKPIGFTEGYSMMRKDYVKRSE